MTERSAVNIVKQGAPWWASWAAFIFAKKHLHRYAAEFEFRYNNRSANGVEDVERGAIALRAMAGKRLTYAQPTNH